METRGAPPKSFEKALAKYRKDPALFLKHAYDVELWDKQEEILRDVINNRYVAVKACYSSGKSYLAACAMHCFLALYPYTVVLTTAPTFRQLSNLWEPAHLIYEQTRHAQLDLDLGIRMLRHEARVGPSWFARGFTTDDPENIQGIHTKGKFLIIVDESAAVDAAIHAKIGALMTNDRCHRFDIGNPLDPSGFFKDCFEDPKYIKHTISAYDVPNVVCEEEVVPGLVTKTWVDEKRIEYGEDSSLWKAEVLAEFPDESEDQLIPLSWIRRAQEAEGGPNGPEVYGFDPSGGGMAEAVLVTKAGNYIYPPKSWMGLDSPSMIRRLHQHTLPKSVVYIDSIGVGFGVVGQAKEEGLPVKGVNVQTPPDDTDKFHNLRAELYWKLREALNPANEESLVLPKDDKLMAQLGSIKYKHDTKGRIQIESKDNMRKRGLASPDRADALALTFVGGKGRLSASGFGVLSESFQGLNQVNDFMQMMN